jgi:hypothetical protein
MVERILARRYVERMVCSTGERTRGIDRAARAVEKRAGYVSGVVFVRGEWGDGSDVLAEPVAQRGLLVGGKMGTNAIGNQKDFLGTGTNRDVATERAALATSQGPRIGSRTTGRGGVCGAIILGKRTNKLIRVPRGTDGLKELGLWRHRMKSPN